MLFLLLVFFLFPALSFAEGEGNWQVGNEFDFAVALEYDVESGVISEGVYEGTLQSLEEWTGDVEDLDIENFESPPPVWTNYDQSGLPSEIFATPQQSDISQTGTTNASSFGMTGIDSAVHLSADGYYGNRIPMVPVGYISGKGSAVTKIRDVGFANFSPTVQLSKESVRTALMANRLPAGFLRDYYLKLADAVYDFLSYFDPFGDNLRSWICRICVGLASFHMLWASAVIGSSVFRAVVAGLTGISGGK